LLAEIGWLLLGNYAQIGRVLSGNEAVTLLAPDPRHAPAGMPGLTLCPLAG
jgi:hypothetical protein